jgi:hypothetical protein
VDSTREARNVFVVVAGTLIALAISAAPLAAQDRKERKATVDQVASVIAEDRSDLLAQIGEVDASCPPGIGCIGLGSLDS